MICLYIYLICKEKKIADNEMIQQASENWDSIARSFRAPNQETESMSLDQESSEIRDLHEDQISDPDESVIENQAKYIQDDSMDSEIQVDSSMDRQIL